MVNIMVITYFAVLGVTAWLLVQMYRSRKKVGYLVLLLALPAWPVLTAGARFVLSFSMVSKGQMTLGDLIMLLSYGGATIQSLLFLLGLWLLLGPIERSTDVPPNTPLQADRPSAGG